MGLSTKQGRTLPFQAVHYIRGDVAYNTTGISSSNTVEIGVLPVGAMVTDCCVKVTTAFNAGATNVLIFGTSTNDDEFIDAADVTEGTPGTYPADRAPAGYGYVNTTTDGVIIYAKYSQTGTAATTGAATFVLQYVLDNDG